jgi:hypothetical protein
VFAHGDPLPALRPERIRNVVACFLGRDMRDVSAFRIWPDPVRPES